MKASFYENEEMNSIKTLRTILKDEINSGKIESITPISRNGENVKIILKPSTDYEVANVICRKMHRAGYITNVTNVRAAVNRRRTQTFVLHLRRSPKTISVGRGSRSAFKNIVVIGKVIVPNPPPDFSDWPNPNGTPPKTTDPKNEK